MLEPILGSRNAEKVLLFIFARGEGYPREIARFFDTDYFPIRQQLEKFGVGGVFYSRLVGRTRLYAFNPRYPFLSELKGLLKKALSFYPAVEQEKLVKVRQRPRRPGKPL